ncbi:MAG: hypothetical protein C5B53_01070 [Candidatus Melainabacteria bacterium]|nr:MAG: hypothetical protein C5B53_01070 [Candidatus Melainabacteria bacterium]
MTFEIKTSRAKQLWLAVFLFVLALMYLETRNQSLPDYNFLLQANAEAEGATVLIDGQVRGILTASDHYDLAGTHFRDQLKPGTHVIEVQKPGFKPVRQTVPMHMEAFMGVDLKPEETKNSKAFMDEVVPEKASRRGPDLSA